MKSSFSSLFATAIACIMLVALTSCKVQEEPIMPEVSFDACGSIGTVMEHECGLYIAVEKGPNIYPNSTKNVSLSPGLKVRLGYIRSSSISSNSHSGTCSGEGNCGCSNNSQNTNSSSLTLSPEATCMMENGISPAIIICLEVDDKLN